MQYLKSVKEYILKNKRFVLIFLTILFVGIFLRAYNFEPWLRFNQDQARDALLIENIAEGKEPLPLLGPIAAKTPFRIGPAYYYMQYISGKIFGVSPVTVALPDLFFSIATIPLLYMLLRRFFEKRTSLFVLTIFSLSYYVVRYSRFAWNPNPQPFFIILFLLAFLEILNAKESHKKYKWSLVAGLALGIGVQLQTLTLILLPIVTFLFCAVLLEKRLITWKMVTAMAMVAIFINIPQIVSEIQTKGQNTQYFMNATSAKSTKNKTFTGSLSLSLECNFQSNVNILSSLGSQNTCDLFRADDNIHKKDPIAKKIGIYTIYSLASIFTLVFSVGGYILLAYFIRREKDTFRKTGLQLIGIFVLVAYVIFFPVSHEVTMRFFLVQEFLPFFLLALWITFLNERKKCSSIVIAGLLFALALLNLYAIQKDVRIYKGIVWDGYKNMQFVTLEEAKNISEFIAKTTNASTVYIDGKNMDVDEYIQSITFFNRTLTIKKYKGGDIGEVPLYLITSVFPDRNKPLSNREREEYNGGATATFGRVTITKLEPIQKTSE